jgi:hypothetical protein
MPFADGGCMQVDLLFVDFTLNDGFEDVVARNSRVRVMERLLRRALAKPHAPAVVLMQVGDHNGACRWSDAMHGCADACGPASARVHHPLKVMSVHHQLDGGLKPGACSRQEVVACAWTTRACSLQCVFCCTDSMVWTHQRACARTAIMQVLTQNSGYDGVDWSPGRRPPHITLEDLYGAVAQHYDQPWLSMRAAMWRYMVAPRSEVTEPGNSSTWSFHSFYPDGEDVHPNDLGQCSEL